MVREGIDESDIFLKALRKKELMEPMTRGTCLEYKIEGIDISIGAVRRVLWQRQYMKVAHRLIVDLYNKKWALEKELEDERCKNELGNS